MRFHFWVLVKDGSKKKEMSKMNYIFTPDLTLISLLTRATEDMLRLGEL